MPVTALFVVPVIFAGTPVLVVVVVFTGVFCPAGLLTAVFLVVVLDCGP
jgi:hypothetical protein